MERIDCLVVGAGVVGLAVARALAEASREVIVVDAADGIGTGTSSRNSEVIHAGIYYPPGNAEGGALRARAPSSSIRIAQRTASSTAAAAS